MVVVTEIASYLQTGKFKIVVDFRPTRYAALVLIGRQRWVDANPALAKALVGAIIKGAKVIQDDPATAAKSVKLLYPNFDDAQKARLEQALTDAGVDHTIETYNAMHGFVPRDTPVHDEAATARHWETLLALFAAKLKPGVPQ